MLKSIISSLNIQLAYSGKIIFCVFCEHSNAVAVLCLPIWSTQHDSSQPRQDFSAFIAHRLQVSVISATVTFNGPIFIDLL